VIGTVSAARIEATSPSPRSSAPSDPPQPASGKVTNTRHTVEICLDTIVAPVLWAPGSDAPVERSTQVLGGARNDRRTVPGEDCAGPSVNHGVLVCSLEI
jgi:hypothetical protein